MISPRLDGGRGIAMDPVVVVFCFGGSAGVASFNSENKSPSKSEIFFSNLVYLTKLKIDSQYLETWYEVAQIEVEVALW